MRPVRTKETNKVYSAKHSDDLPATLHKFQWDGRKTAVNTVETCWELTQEEIDVIVNTKKLFVNFVGNTVPPVYLSTNSLLKPKE